MRDVEIGIDDIIVQRAEREGMVAANEGELTVALETGLTEALVAEGLAREFVSRVQGMRKEADFEVTQRIKIAVNWEFGNLGSEEVAKALERFRDYVMAETLCVGLELGGGERGEGGEEVDLNGRLAKVGVWKA